MLFLSSPIHRYLESIPSWDADLFSYTWIGGFVDPLAFLELFRSTSTYPYGRVPCRNAPCGALNPRTIRAAALVWLGTGFFIVQEGQNAVITQFGRYHSTVMDAGLHWRLPWPIQRQETVNVTQIRSVDVGDNIIIPATGLRTSAMLTSDENIVEVKFAVQYRLSDARAYLFESKLPDDALRQASESAVREVLGNMKMDAVLSEERDQIAPRVRELTQKIRRQIGRASCRERV